jgi:riboflavin synthase
MFTGIVQQVGTIVRAAEINGHLALTINPEKPWEDLALGESVACSGTCLTVVTRDNAGFTVELSHETMLKTAPNWQVGEQLNLERAMTLATRLGGHIVSGHIDGTGEIVEIKKEPGAYVVKVSAAPSLARYLVSKGSITVDGVSLTIVDTGGPGGVTNLQSNEFTLWLIPHTLEITTLKKWCIGTIVNLEADQLAKYVERLLLMQKPTQTEVCLS